MALEPEVKERLSVLAQEITDSQKPVEWWQVVTVYNMPPPVPWELIDLTQDALERKGREKRERSRKAKAGKK